MLQTRGSKICNSILSFSGWIPIGKETLLHYPDWNQPFDVPPGEFVDEKSNMISGMIPIILEINGTPLTVLWRNKDVNSPLAFRPLRYAPEVSFHEFFIKLPIRENERAK